MGHQHSIHSAGTAEERKKIFEDRFSHILNFIQNGGDDEREARDEGQLVASTREEDANEAPEVTSVGVASP
jgi:hypothetical protein